MTDTLSVDDDVVLFAAFPVVDDIVDELLLVVIVLFRKKNILRAVGDTAPESDITGVTSHYLDNAAALMGGGSITNLIDGFHCRVDCGIETDGVLGAGDIQVDSSRNTDGVDAESSQFLCSCEGTVATDNYQSLNSVFTADLCSLCLAFRCTHLRTAGGVKHRTSAGNRIRNRSCCQILDLAVDQTIVSFINAFYIQTFCNTTADNRTDGSVHARCIAAACKNSDRFNRICHD